MKHIPSSGELYATIDAVRQTVEAGPALDEIITAIRAVIRQVDELEHAQQNVIDRAYWVRAAVDRCEVLEIDGMLNSLGEVQGSGAALDVAVAVFCERQEKARAALTRLEKLTGLGKDL